MTKYNMYIFINNLFKGFHSLGGVGLSNKTGIKLYKYNPINLNTVLKYIVNIE